jgi:hypothetical protein
MPILIIAASVITLIIQYVNILFDTIIEIVKLKFNCKMLNEFQ